MISIKKKRKLRSILGIVCAVTIASANASVYAAPSSQELENKTSNLQGELNSLNSELSTLSKQLEDTSSQIESLAGEIEKSKLDLAAAKISEENQYNAMKERIKFMYEGGNVSLLEILFTSESMADFLNNAEYVATISNYDRTMLAEYQAVRQEVENKQAALESQRTDLSTLQSTLTGQREELTSKISSTSGQLADYSAQLERAKAAEAALEIARNNELSAKLPVTTAPDTTQAKNTPAPAETPKTSNTPKAPADSKPKETPAPSNNQETPTDTDKKTATSNPQPENTDTVALLAAILQAEAGGSDYEGLLAVGTVIMNRVESSRFPGNVRDVIYQKGQFSPTWNGSLDKILTKGPTATAYRAAQDVLGGARHSSILGLYSFRDKSSPRSGIRIGGNVFF